MLIYSAMKGYWFAFFCIPLQYAINTSSLALFDQTIGQTSLLESPLLLTTIFDCAATATAVPERIPIFCSLGGTPYHR